VDLDDAMLNLHWVDYVDPAWRTFWLSARRSCGCMSLIAALAVRGRGRLRLDNRSMDREPPELTGGEADRRRVSNGQDRCPIDIEGNESFLPTRLGIR
jgi:hypothetical protein